jgi:ABC-2 type transport system ATP-binding protein
VDEGTTVVLTTQYLEEADRLAGRVAVVDRGRVIANDTPAALKATLGSTVIEFVMPSGDGAASAARILAPVAGSAGAAPELDGSRVRLTAGDGSALLVDSLHALEVSGLRPAGVQVREPTMDDVFLLLTGHHVEEGPVDGRVGPDTPASAAAERRAAA